MAKKIGGSCFAESIILAVSYLPANAKTALQAAVN
jgi:hypothetical protein